MDPESGQAELTLLDEIQIGIWSFGVGEHVVVPLGRSATVEDLRLTKFKAEIIDGRLVVIGPTVYGSAEAAWKIRHSLYEYHKSDGGGYEFGMRARYVVDLPHRQAFCPDVSWYKGDPPDSEVLPGAPAFAVEVRDPNEYGDEEERRMTAKRADYFAAGTQVVWDVDALREELIRAYRANDPDHPVVYRRGEVADAEPAVPGWRFPVDELFD
jgi:Uma2 family endonuclease